MQQPKYDMGPGEYKNVVRNPFNKFPCDVTTAGTNPANVSAWVPVPVKYDPDGKTMSGGLHHGAFIGEDGFVYIWGDSNAPSFPQTPSKSTIGNATQVIAFDSGGDAFGAGVLVLTADGKVILIGCSQSGFRGDGTAGNSFESTPFTIPLPEPITEIAAAVYAYAVGKSGKLYQWGGSLQDAYWAALASGVGKSGAALNSISVVAIPEAVAHVQTGGSYWGMAVAVSGKIYGWAKDAGFLGMKPGLIQGAPANITTILNLPGTLHRLALGSEASFALMENGDLYGWGNNTQAAVGNGQEGIFANYTAPWGVASNSLWVSAQVKINPAGVSFCGLWVGPSATFYTYAEDTNGNLWVWGRNKGFVLWNGQGGDSTTQAAQPNKWDVLAPTKIVGFGPFAPTPPVPVNQAPGAAIAVVANLTWPANGVQLDGTSSKDPDGTIAAYKWTVPAGVIISDPTSLKPIVLFPAPGTYSIALTVTDNAGGTGTTTIQVVVNNAPTPRKVTNFSVTLLGQPVTAAAADGTFTFDDGSTQ